MKFLLLADRLLFWLFFRWHYRRRFAAYGEDVRWGKHFRRRTIPASVRISCPEKIAIGDGCRIDEGVYLQCHLQSPGIAIGPGSRINAHTHVLAYSRIEIGANVLIAPFALLTSGNHGYARTDLPIMHQPHEPSGDIVIESGTWIGQGAKVMGGARVGRNCVIAAGAVVTKAFTDHSVLGGVPARCLRMTAPA